ncbi:hypothetical protein FB45DRAFT_874524 [Roridomyces roridus]|uniref:Uncharacterized protein n=1 Tax=Roridomyces roridus TaxID=1738132 RepID=A0AAD7B992_9AGAR|nr:hypothetical protein FB45DRAFT_874524 [Roridomyces roridus]
MAHGLSVSSLHFNLPAHTRPSLRALREREIPASSAAGHCLRGLPGQTNYQCRFEIIDWFVATYPMQTGTPPSVPLEPGAFSELWHWLKVYGLTPAVFDGCDQDAWPNVITEPARQYIYSLHDAELLRSLHVMYDLEGRTLLRDYVFYRQETLAARRGPYHLTSRTDFAARHPEDYPGTNMLYLHSHELDTNWGGIITHLKTRLEVASLATPPATTVSGYSGPFRVFVVQFLVFRVPLRRLRCMAHEHIIWSMGRIGLLTVVSQLSRRRSWNATFRVLSLVFEECRRWKLSDPPRPEINSRDLILRDCSNLRFLLNVWREADVAGRPVVVLNDIRARIIEICEDNDYKLGVPYPPLRNVEPLYSLNWSRSGAANHSESLLIAVVTALMCYPSMQEILARERLEGRLMARPLFLGIAGAKGLLFSRFVSLSTGCPLPLTTITVAVVRLYELYCHRPSLPVVAMGAFLPSLLGLGVCNCTYTSFEAWSERYDIDRQYYAARSAELHPDEIPCREDRFQRTRQFFNDPARASREVADLQLHVRGQHNIRIMLDLLDEAVFLQRPAEMIDALRTVTLWVCASMHFRPVLPLPPFSSR